MKYVLMQDKEIPAIALGTWSWGTGFNGGNRIFGNEYRMDDLMPVFNKALEQGFTLWDTAPIYGLGASETILGELSKNKEIILSTKFTPLGIQLKGAMRKSLDKSLSRLGVDHADIFWVHNPKNVKKWTQELIPLMKKAKIKYAGVSNHNLHEIQLATSLLAKEGLKLSAVQNHYSLLYRASEESGVIDWCHKNKVVFFAYMTLEQGALTGKYNASNPFKSGTRRGKAFNPEVLAKLDNLIHVMRDIGASHSAEPAHIAMAWALAKGTVPIIGVTKVSHIDDAHASLSIELKPNERVALEKAARDTGVEIKGFWEKKIQ